MPCTGYFRITPEMLELFRKDKILNTDFKRYPIDLSSKALSKCKDVRMYLGRIVTEEDLERKRKIKLP